METGKIISNKKSAQICVESPCELVQLDYDDVPRIVLESMERIIFRDWEEELEYSKLLMEEPCDSCPKIACTEGWLMFTSVIV